MITEQVNAEAQKDELVCGQKIEDWIRAWHRWYLGIPDKKHPIFSHLSREYERRQDQNQGKLSFLELRQSELPEECEAKVWFLTGGYQGAITTRSFIPAGNFYILAPVYSAWASIEEYPSLKSEQQLNDFCAQDVSGANIQAELDGHDLSTHHIRIETPFSVSLHGGNVLGVRVPTRKKKTIKLVSNGYWIWLKPLSIGDHRLHFRGITSRFMSELNLSLSVAGPK